MMIICDDDRDDDDDGDGDDDGHSHGHKGDGHDDSTSPPPVQAGPWRWQQYGFAETICKVGLIAAPKPRIDRNKPVGYYKHALGFVQSSCKRRLLDWHV